MSDITKRSRELRQKMVALVTEFNTLSLKILDMRDDLHRLEILMDPPEPLVDLQVDNEVELVRPEEVEP